jgi:hypothetical protein
MLTERLTPASTFFWSPHVTPGARERLACFLAVRNYDTEDELMREKKIVYIWESRRVRLTGDCLGSGNHIWQLEHKGNVNPLSCPGETSVKGIRGVDVSVT